MSNFTTLCLGDYHLKDFQHKNQYLEKFEYEVSLESFKVIYKIIEDNNISKLLILGDLVDSVPNSEALKLVHIFLSGLPKRLEIIMVDGNHELITGKAKKQYYWYGIKQKMLDTYGVKVLEYNEVGNTLFVNHGNISKLETLSKNYDIVYSHFRSNLMPLASDEINIEMLEHKAKLVIASDIHYRCFHSNIVYTGSVFDTHFSSSNELPDHQPSVLLLNEDTLEWDWKDTLTTSYRKYKRVYPSVKKFLEDVGNLEQDAISNNNFYKIVIQDKRHNLKALDTSLYKHFAIIETSITDLLAEKQNNEVAKKVVESLSSKDISSNLLDFILKNNDRIELVDNIKMAYHSYDVAALKEINDKA